TPSQIYHDIYPDMLGSLLSSSPIIILHQPVFSCATLCFYPSYHKDVQWDLDSFFAALPYLAQAIAVRAQVILRPPAFSNEAALKNAFAGAIARHRWWTQVIGPEWHCPHIRIDLQHQPSDFVNLLVIGMVKVGLACARRIAE